MVKDCLKKLNTKTFTAIFVSVFTLVISLASFIKLMDHYINKTEINNDYSDTMGTQLEADVLSTLAGKMWFIDVNGGFRRLTFQPEMNNVIKLKNGYLATTCEKSPDERIDFIVSEISRFNDMCSERGIDFLYVIPPYELSKYDNQLPVGFTDYTNDNIDYFSGALNNAGVPNINVGEMLHEDNLNLYDYFYVTDMHWNAQGAFYTFEKMAEYLEKEDGYSFDERVLNEENYEIKTFKNCFLGSEGDRTGRYFAGMEDFSVYVPKFETEYVNFENEDGGKTVSFEEAAYDYSCLSNEGDSDRTIYALLLSPARSHFVNKTSGNNKRVLVISDSFGKALMPFVMLGFEEGGWISGDQLTAEFLDSFPPDLIIMNYHNIHLNDAREPWMINMVYE